MVGWPRMWAYMGMYEDGRPDTDVWGDADVLRFARGFPEAYRSEVGGSCVLLAAADDGNSSSAALPCRARERLPPNIAVCSLGREGWRLGWGWGWREWRREREARRGMSVISLGCILRVMLAAWGKSYRNDTACKLQHFAFHSDSLLVQDSRDPGLHWALHDRRQTPRPQPSSWEAIVQGM